MEFNTYQEFAKTTAVYPHKGNNISYVTLGLCGEAGELANKVKKIQRDFNGVITPDYREKLVEELGDALWYIAMVADEINLPLDIIATHNIAKLKDRQFRDKIKGEGDNR